MTNPRPISATIEWNNRAVEAMRMSDLQLNAWVASKLYGKIPYTIPDYCQNMAFAWVVFQQLVIDHGCAAITMDMEDYGREPGDIGSVSAGLGPALSMGVKRVPRAICELYYSMAEL